MEKIGYEARTETPKPCDYFDMIGGTSTGGLIAIMLGRLEMSVDQCIEAYTTLSEEIFAKESKARFRFSLRGDLKSQFDAKRLEKAIMKILQDVGMDENTLHFSPNAKCKV
jgi:patatin-like phospholipase/acyl hydrolase